MNDKNKGLLIVYTGHGKGKTTAALGIVFRALGRGIRVAMVQFIKGKWKTGEGAFAEKLAGLTFLVMGFAFFVFGVGTFNIFMVLTSNLEFIAGYGWQALMDGAARQFVELVVTGYLSMAAYVLFKACELRLAHELASGKSAREN